MTREFRLMLAEQGAADPEMMGGSMTAPKSAAEVMREACARVCDAIYRSDQDSGLYGLGFCDSTIACRNAVSALPLSADPRDGEIERLRAALEDLVDAAGCLLSGVGCIRGKTPEDDDWWLHERDHETELTASEKRARAALAQSGEAG